MEVASRSSRSSTLTKKKYPGGTLFLVGANSPADLRSKTIQYLGCDEVDEWVDDLADQGDPMEMCDARQISFHATGNYKKLQGSTPTILNSSRINDSFLAGDQRFFNVPCPHCDEEQVLVFGGVDKPFGLKFNKTYPYNAHYVCKH